jgi:hypothetical protein
MVSELYSKDNYLINAQLIKSVLITEYDISKANISVLLEKGVITRDLYMYLYNLPKIDREVFIGKMISTDSSIYKAIKSGIVTAKKNLFLQNQIQDSEIIRIANDAVYIMRNARLSYTRFNNVEFLPKRHYTTFVRLRGVAIFFSSSMGEIDIDVVGLGREQTSLHADYMLTFIGNLLYLMENSTMEQVMEYFLGFYDQYLNKQLDIQYYREFNENSLFTVSTSNSGKFGMMYTDNVNNIDIGYNAGVLRELYGIIAGTQRSQ